MSNPLRHMDRREFLRRGALLIPALHAGLLGTAAGASGGVAATAGKARQPVEFLELELHSHRIEEQHTFYRDTLGLDTALEGDSLVVRAGASRLRFVPSADGSEPMYHFAFMIPENKLERAIEWMKGRSPLQPNTRDGGVVFHFRRWNAHSVYFFDPAGHLAEFIAHHELPTSAPGAFSPRDILYACEIGLVTPEMDPLLDALEGRLGLTPLFDPSPGFAPVGDRHGLFICVQEQRIWLASDLRAQIYPVEATIRGTGEGIVELGELPYRVRTVL